MTEAPGLKRTLSLWQVVSIGLTWMAPASFFSIYGIGATASKGMLTLAYAIAFFAFLFTAYSYAMMAKAFPISGSAYTFTQKAINPHLGFLVGWTLLMDYLFAPLMNSLIFGLFLNMQFPSVPMYVWSISFSVLITLVNIFGVNFSANINKIFIVLQFVFFALFFFFSIKGILGGMGTGTLFSTAPFYNSEVSFSALISTAALISFSFIGFDSVTTLSEETINPQKNIPKAIFLIMIIIAVTYMAASYIAYLVHPGFVFENPDTASYEVFKLISGNLLSSFFTAIVIVSSPSTAMASITTASRILYVMGRDSVLPNKIFGYIHPRYQTPVINIILLGAISLLSLVISLKTALSMINFGALMAFIFVNLSVISHYFYRKGKRTLVGVILYVIFPLLGACFIGCMWLNLDRDSLMVGSIWLVCGIVYLLFLTKFFRKRPPEFDFSESEQNKSVS